MSADRRCELLAAADAAALVALAERVLDAGTRPEVVRPAEVGMVVLTVREPVCGDRFHLAEVLVTQAEVIVDGARGWAMRIGDDREATMAAAVCEAEVAAGRPAAGAVLALCAATETRLAQSAATEWAELAPTEVRFEEMD